MVLTVRIRWPPCASLSHLVPAALFHSLSPAQSDLIAGKYMKAPPEAALADKAASKARKAARRSASSGNTGGGAQDFRRYTSPSGFAVLVGRNSRQNDTLTMDLANPGDVWMHARCVGA